MGSMISNKQADFGQKRREKPKKARQIRVNAKKTRGMETVLSPL
jgi:hypothetical protein